MRGWAGRDPRPPRPHACLGPGPGCLLLHARRRERGRGLSHPARARQPQVDRDSARPAGARARVIVHPSPSRGTWPPAHAWGCPGDRPVAAAQAAARSPTPAAAGEAHPPLPSGRPAGSHAIQPPGVPLLQRHRLRALRLQTVERRRRGLQQLQQDGLHDLPQLWRRRHSGAHPPGHSQARPAAAAVISQPASQPASQPECQPA